MSNKLGRLIEGEASPDVVQLVRVPAIAADYLECGRPVDLRNGIASRVTCRGAGIIDPFFGSWVNPGERCWVLLWPGATLEMALKPEEEWIDDWHSFDSQNFMDTYGE